MLRIGQRLHDARIGKDLSLDDVAKATKIRPSFLSAIEKGEYQRLPSPTYAQGFVKNYAEFLGLPRRETLALFRREFREDSEYAVLPKTLAGEHAFPLHRIKIQQKMLAFVFVVLLIIGFLFYQYRYAVFSPPLTVDSPKNGVVTTQEIVVLGKTDPKAIVTVNNEAVAIDTDGNFIKKLTVFPGKSEILVKAKNRLNNETVIKREIDVQP